MSAQSQQSIDDAPSTVVDPPIVFLGPSMTVEEARRILPHADYRPPAVRGDIDAVPDGGIVGLIDGRFEQDRSLSQREIYNALQRGVSVIGSSSMGALRACEVRGVYGVGRIYEMYRTGVIDRDDEVALVFDDENFRPLSVPLVNVRYALECLVRAGTLDRQIGDKLLKIAQKLHYTERTYKWILREAGLLQAKDAEHLMELLASFDLKKEDAHLLLESLPDFVASQRDVESPRVGKPLYGQGQDEWRDHFAEIRTAAVLPAEASVLIWEYGDRVEFENLLTFLKVTGEFGRHACNAVARFLLAGNGLKPSPEKDPSVPLPEEDALFAQIIKNWGWESAEEHRVTLRDLGMGFRDLRQCVADEVSARRALSALARERSAEFYKAVRAELLMDGLALKRAALRAGSLAYFAERARALQLQVTEADRLAARSVISWINRNYEGTRLEGLEQRLAAEGVDDAALAAFVDELACARVAAADVASALWQRRPPIKRLQLSSKVKATMRLVRSPKTQGSRRFCTNMNQAGRYARQIASRIGVTRIGMIGELTRLGVHISQATRPHSSWSTTTGSGKGTTRVGAQVGGVMEEAEKFAQENFEYDVMMGSYAELSAKTRVIDPSTLDLPYDSNYGPTLEIPWITCHDLITGHALWAPAAAFDHRRVARDIYYSSRRGRKVYTTNGLASGFSSTEALLHAICEVIERHSLTLHEIEFRNPGELGGGEFEFIDNATLPKYVGKMMRGFERAGVEARILDMTSEVRVPSFVAWLRSTDGMGSRLSMGTACHPDPAVALEMALLEAAQTEAGNAAGSREDLTVKARSLGRHERPRPNPKNWGAALIGPYNRIKAFEEVRGFVSKDVLAELEWVLGGLVAAGIEHVVVAELTCAAVKPASVFRVLIPGLETINPFYIGPRARAHGIRYLLNPAQFDPIQ